jgi:outer membrane immunogenic protein
MRHIVAKGWLLATAVLALGVAATQAHAQQWDSTASLVFDGSYVGLQGGYGMTTAEATFSNGIGSISGEEDGSAFIGGAFVGYGLTNGNLFGGVEVEGLFSGIEESATEAGLGLTVEQKYSVGISGRVGYVVTDNILLYGRAGWVWTQFEASATDGIDSESDDDWFNGPRVGVGAEVAVASGLFGRIEYTHTWYNDNDYRIGPISAELGGDEDLFMVGVGYRF